MVKHSFVTPEQLIDIGRCNRVLTQNLLVSWPCLCSYIGAVSASEKDSDYDVYVTFNNSSISI
jgi:hypothetical protein